ncbi:SLC13 family permease [Thioclava sp. GXIMD4215]|uniref:SLC13 family permease n=1 Tax=Thioclava sp. GXIMD4215 TaxID=3131928 RepID=UPI003253272F
MFFAAAMMFSVAPASVIFSGFASAAFWLVLSGYVIGLAIAKTGLAARAARVLAMRLGRFYPRLVFGTIALSYGLAFVMPSNMGRIALLMPIILALATALGTFQLSASVLPANVPNLVMLGAVETSYGLHLSYFPYLLANLPVLGLLKGAVLGVCVLLMFRDRSIQRPAESPRIPITAAEKRLALLLVVTLGLWLTDSLHKIAPAWIGLAAACLCLLPKVGFVSGEEFGTKVNHRSALYVAAILGLAALVAQSGLGARIGAGLLAYAPLDAQGRYSDVVTLAGLAGLLNFVVTANGVPALFTPLAQALADGSGLPLSGVLMLRSSDFRPRFCPIRPPRSLWQWDWRVCRFGRGSACA